MIIVVLYSVDILFNHPNFDPQITEEFEEIPVQSRGFGILDVGYRSQVISICINLIALGLHT